MSYKTCFSVEDAQSLLTEMSDFSVLNGLFWIADGETLMKRKDQTIGSKKMYKCPYYDQSQCPFKVRIVKTPQNSVPAYTSVSCLFDVQYTSKMPHVPHVHQDSGESRHFLQMLLHVV